MLRFLFGIVVAMLVVVGGIWLLQRRLIYFPTREVPPVSEQLPGWEEASCETADGLTLRGWFTSPPKGEPVVVVFTGTQATGPTGPCSPPTSPSARSSAIATAASSCSRPRPG